MLEANLLTNTDELDSELLDNSNNIEAELIGGDTGTYNHSELYNLEYENSGHIGFQQEIEDLEEIRDGASKGATAVQDSNYVHTDNNYTSEEKIKLSELENYDDTEIKQDILDLETNKQDELTAGENITIIDNVISATGGSGGNVDDVQLNGTSIVNNKIANIPLATSNIPGVVTIEQDTYGLFQGSDSLIGIQKASNSEINAKNNNYKPIVPANLNYAIEKGLGNNTLTWTNAEKTSARATIEAQEALVSGTNIKTINSQSLLGSGNIEISGGSSDYTDLTNKPQINGVTLQGNKTLSDLQADYNDLLNKPMKILDMEYGDVNVYDIEDYAVFKVINAGGIYNDDGAYLYLDEGSLLMKGDYGICYIGSSGVYWLQIDALSWDYSFCVSQEEVDDMLKSKEDIYQIYDYPQSSISINLATNTEIRFTSIMTTLKVTPSSLIDNYIASFAFTSGSTATSFEYVSTIKWQGDDCSDLMFIPTANKRYYCMIWYDGSIYHGSVRGVPLE